MPKHSFSWNLPAEWDEFEPPCTVTFHYTPGSGEHLHHCDPDHSPAVVEDIHVLFNGKDLDEDAIDPFFLPQLEEACWDRVERMGPDDGPDEDEDAMHEQRRLFRAGLREEALEPRPLGPAPAAGDYGPGRPKRKQHNPPPAEWKPAPAAKGPANDDTTAT